MRKRSRRQHRRVRRGVMPRASVHDATSRHTSPPRMSRAMSRRYSSCLPVPRTHDTYISSMRATHAMPSRAALPSRAHPLICYARCQRRASMPAMFAAPSPRVMAGRQKRRRVNRQRGKIVTAQQASLR